MHWKRVNEKDMHSRRTHARRNGMFVRVLLGFLFKWYICLLGSPLIAPTRIPSGRQLELDVRSLHDAVFLRAAAQRRRAFDGAGPTG
jgi:hypothetical protein